METSTMSSIGFRVYPKPGIPSQECPSFRTHPMHDIATKEAIERDPAATDRKPLANGLGGDFLFLVWGWNFAFGLGAQGSGQD